MSYLRGLDGERPSAQRDKSSTPSQGAPGDNGKTTAAPRPSQLEGAEGDGQFDYLRRLADRIRRTDEELRRDGNGQIDAIGIVGTDVYDKLLVLQALRPYFPDALYFTNDFDAALLHPAQANWTRGLLDANRRLRHNLDAITRNFALPETSALLRRAWRAPAPHRMAHFLDIFSRKFRLAKAPRSVPIDIRFWGSYVWQGRLAARVARATVAVLAMLAFSEILVGLFGQPVVPSHRGAVGTLYLWVTFASGIAMLYLLFLVADAAVYSVWFLRELRKPESQWPQRMLLAFQKRFGFLSSFPDDWIDLQFIAQRTKATSIVIYYPFIAIALMIVSRSKIFDNFSDSIPILVTLGISLAIMVGCSVALPRAAENSRQIAIARLNEQIIAAAKNPDLVAQLSALLARAQALAEAPSHRGRRSHW